MRSALVSTKIVGRVRTPCTPVELGGRRPARSIGSGQNDDRYALGVANVQKVRVRCGKGLASGPRHLRSHAIGETHFATTPLVVPSTELSDRDAECGVNRQAIEQTQLSDVERSILLVSAGDPHEVIEHLSDPEGGQRRRIAVEQGPNLGSSDLTLEVGQHGVRVENGQREWLREASSARACLRERSLLGPRPRYFPPRSSIGSSLRGRMTTRSPRSTTTSLRTPQRARASAGMETCPFLDSVMTWLMEVMA